MEILSGIGIAEEIRNRVREGVRQSGLTPTLGIIVVGDDKENLVYVGLKEKAVAFVGGRTHHVTLEASVTGAELLHEIDNLNRNPAIDGILLQLPLPESLRPYTDEFLAAISPAKDVDGFHPMNRGRLFYGEPLFISCAALGCLEVIARSLGGAEGKRAVLVGDSFDLIMPLTVILTQRGCQVTVLAETPPDNRLPDADLYVLEKGGPKTVRAGQLAPGSLVMDAGFYWHFDHMCGNVDRDSLAQVPGQLLAVPGGLGPILVAELMENLLLAARRTKSR